MIEEVKAEEERERSQEDSGGPASKSSTKSHSSDSEDSSDDDDEGGWFEGGVDIDIPGVGEVEIGISHDGDEEGGLSIQAGLYEEGVVIDPLQGTYSYDNVWLVIQLPDKMALDRVSLFRQVFHYTTVLVVQLRT